MRAASATSFVAKVASLEGSFVESSSLLLNGVALSSEGADEDDVLDALVEVVFEEVVGSEESDGVLTLVELPEGDCAVVSLGASLSEPQDTNDVATKTHTPAITVPRRKRPAFVPARALLNDQECVIVGTYISSGLASNVCDKTLITPGATPGPPLSSMLSSAKGPAAASSSSVGRSCSSVSCS